MIAAGTFFARRRNGRPGRPARVHQQRDGVMPNDDTLAMDQFGLDA